MDRFFSAGRVGLSGPGRGVATDLTGKELGDLGPQAEQGSLVKLVSLDGGIWRAWQCLRTVEGWAGLGLREVEARPPGRGKSGQGTA